VLQLCFASNSYSSVGVGIQIIVTHQQTGTRIAEIYYKMQKGPLGLLHHKEMENYNEL
jgi:hypothetical protein